MQIEIFTKSLQFNIYGFGDTAVNKDYTGTAFKLSDKMWELIKNNNIKNKGLNIWVYENADKVFAGVELEDDNNGNHYGLEEKKVNLEKYAYYKHIGPYNLIKRVGQNMITELTRQGFRPALPNIEIYGHWTNDENQLETELLMSLK